MAKPLAIRSKRIMIPPYRHDLWKLGSYKLHFARIVPRADRPQGRDENLRLQICLMDGCRKRDTSLVGSILQAFACKESKPQMTSPGFSSRSLMISLMRALGIGQKEITVHNILSRHQNRSFDNSLENSALPNRSSSIYNWSHHRTP